MLNTPGVVEKVQADARYPLMLVLVLLGCFTKSAQLPFHFWLPQAMAAPTPVSAYLHSATMVKAGLFLLLRLDEVIGGTPLFEGLVATAGLITMVFAAAVAMFKHDLKGLLAYSTVSHLGLVTFRTDFAFEPGEPVTEDVAGVEAFLERMEMLATLRRYRSARGAHAPVEPAVPSPEPTRKRPKPADPAGPAQGELF
jgi:hypothetical protein